MHDQTVVGGAIPDYAGLAAKAKAMQDQAWQGAVKAQKVIDEGKEKSAARSKKLKTAAMIGGALILGGAFWWAKKKKYV